MTQIRVQVFEAFEDAELTWRAFEETGDVYVFQTFDWLASWYRLVGAQCGVNPCIVALMDGDGRSLMLMPLAIEERGMCRVLTWLGGAISDYHAPLLVDDGATWVKQMGVETIWRALCRELPHFDYADFQRQPEQIGNQANPLRRLAAIKCSHSAHNTRLSGDWPSYYASKRSRKTRHNDRRKRKKLESHGRLDFLIAKTTEEIDRLVTAMSQQKSDYATAIGKNNALAEPGYDDFLRERAQAGLTDGTTVLCGIELNQEILAVQWGAVHRGRLYSVVASYDNGALRSLSPGELLLHELLGWCFDHNIETFDFTYGDEPYKQAWCENTMDLYRSLIPVTTWGMIYVCLLRSVTGLKSLMRKSEWLHLNYSRSLKCFGRSAKSFTYRS